MSGNVYYVDRYQPNTDSLPCNTPGCGVGLKPRLVSPAHTLVGLTLAWTDPKGHASASLYARNLLDKKYILQTDANGIGDWRIYGEPRVVGVRVGLTY